MAEEQGHKLDGQARATRRYIECWESSYKHPQDLEKTGTDTYSQGSYESGPKNPKPHPLRESEQFRNPLLEGLRLTLGDRAAAYGPPAENLQDIAEGWSVIFGEAVSRKQVALAMVWVKICRELKKAQRDNLDDIAGYVNTIFMADHGIGSGQDFPLDMQKLHVTEEEAWRGGVSPWNKERGELE